MKVSDTFVLEDVYNCVNRRWLYDQLQVDYQQTSYFNLSKYF